MQQVYNVENAGNQFSRDLAYTLATFANYQLELTCTQDTRNLSKADTEWTKCMIANKTDIEMTLTLITRNRFDSFDFTFSVLGSNYQLYLKVIEKVNIGDWLNLYLVFINSFFNNINNNNLFIWLCKIQYIQSII